MTKPILFSIISGLTGLLISTVTNSFTLDKLELVLFSLGLIVASFLLTWEKSAKPTLIKGLGLLSLILFSLTLWFVSQNYHKEGQLYPLFVIALIQITMICTSFIQSWKQTKPHYTYPELFEKAWNNHFFLLFSALLTGGFLAILGLGTSLFDSIGMNISKIIWSQEVTPVIVAILLGAGIGISRDYDNLIFKIRSVFFALFRVMAYLSALIVILFSLSLSFSLDTLLENNKTSIILLSVVALSILLLNTLIDKDSNKLPKWANWIFTAQIALLPFLSLLSVYAIYLRIMQYGLMPNRIIALSIAFILSAYSLSYLYQLIKQRGHWSIGLVKTNPTLAILWVSILIGLASPLLDPVRLSVNNQVQRLKTNKISPNNFDFYSLKHRMGARGKDAIKDILIWENHSQFALIKKNISESNSYHSNVKPKLTLSINVIGNPPENLEQLQSHYKSWFCNTKTPCFIKQLRMNDNDEKKTMVFHFRSNAKHSFKLEVYLYEYDNNNHLWENLKTYRSSSFSKDRMHDITEELTQDKQKLIPPEYLDIKVGGIEIRQ